MRRSRSTASIAGGVSKHGFAQYLAAVVVLAVVLNVADVATRVPSMSSSLVVQAPVARQESEGASNPVNLRRNGLMNGISSFWRPWKRSLPRPAISSFPGSDRIPVDLSNFYGVDVDNLFGSVAYALVGIIYGALGFLATCVWTIFHHCLGLCKGSDNAITRSQQLMPTIMLASVLVPACFSSGVGIFANDVFGESVVLFDATAGGVADDIYLLTDTVRGVLDEIVAYIPAKQQEIFDALDQDFEKLINDTNCIIVGIEEVSQDLSDTADKLDAIAADSPLQLNTTLDGQLDAVADTGTQLTHTLRNLTAELTNLFDVANITAGQLGESLGLINSTVEQLDAALEQVDAIGGIFEQAQSFTSLVLPYENYRLLVFQGLYSSVLAVFAVGVAGVFVGGAGVYNILYFVTAFLLVVVSGAFAAHFPLGMGLDDVCVNRVDIINATVPSALVALETLDRCRDDLALFDDSLLSALNDSASVASEALIESFTEFTNSVNFTEFYSFFDEVLALADFNLTAEFDALGPEDYGITLTIEEDLEDVNAITNDSVTYFDVFTEANINSLNVTDYPPNPANSDTLAPLKVQILAQIQIRNNYLAERAVLRSNLTDVESDLDETSMKIADIRTKVEYLEGNITALVDNFDVIKGIFADFEALFDRLIDALTCAFLPEAVDTLISLVCDTSVIALDVNAFSQLSLMGLLTPVTVIAVIAGRRLKKGRAGAGGGDSSGGGVPKLPADDGEFEELPFQNPY